MQNLRIGWFGQLQFDYSTDRTGRLTAVVGATSFNGITTYANSPSYDARGRLKGVSYGNGVQMTISTFNNRLQAVDFEVRKGTTPLIKKEFEYYGDGSLKFSDDGIDPKFDRLYRYDFVGRTTQAKSGAPARGDTDNAMNIPYTMNYTHDAFGCQSALIFDPFTGVSF
ncbi:MAG: hypothetical protein IPN69_15145 [Acidobacteria bacterium]|nr:hypothetical protein [Acidobacteriota bacterium]